jgi:hypothetical protein
VRVVGCDVRVVGNHVRVVGYHARVFGYHGYREQSVAIRLSLLYRLVVAEGGSLFLHVRYVGAAKSNTGETTTRVCLHPTRQLL